MTGHLAMDDKAKEYGSVHGFGERVACRKEEPAVVCEVFNGTQSRGCRDRGIAEMRPRQVPRLPGPGAFGAIHEIAPPSIVATVRSAGGQAYRCRTWFILHLPSYEAVDVAWERMPQVHAAIATGLAASRFEDMCTIAEDQALTDRIEARVRRALDDDRVILRPALVGAEWLD